METQKILIADDDREHLLMLAFLLRQAGFQIISAFDAKNALQMAVEHDPDLLLLDIHLGDEDGFAIQERLLKIKELASTPIIYLTGDQSKWVQSMTNALGAYAVMGKPFDTQQLIATIKQAIAQAEAKGGGHAARTPVVSANCKSTETYIG